MWKTIQNLNFDEKCILLSFFLLFVNPFIHGISIIGLVFYALYKKELKEDVMQQPGYRFLYPLSVLAFFVSCFYQNIYGILISIGFLFVFLYMAYVRKHLNHELFKYILEMMIFCSLFVNIIGLFQFKTISNMMGYSFLDFHLFNSPKRRISATFLNANYYAMVLEFLIICCMVRFVQCQQWKNKIKYVLIGIINLVMIYLTGCRAAFLPFVIMVPTFLFLSKEKKWAWTSIACIALASILIYIKPDIIPRLSDISTVGSRFKIWNCAWTSIQNHPLFGLGPFGYSVAHVLYDGHVAPHAHNIYIDSLVSYGIVGSIFVLLSSLCILKDFCWIYRWKEHPEYFAMGIAFILVILIHGTMDVTILNLCTGCMALLVLNLGVLHSKNI